jgi:hypothetical protein
VKRTITVLQDDIDNGVRWDFGKCAIARAATRDLADVVREDTVEVRGTLHFGGLSGMYGLIPLEASKFIANFDYGRPVEPFKFEVDLKETSSTMALATENLWIRSTIV